MPLLSSSLAADALVDSRALVIQRAFPFVLVRCKHIRTNDARHFEISPALVIGRVVDVSGTLIDRRLRIRAERACTRNDTALEVLSKDPIRRHTLFDPAHQRIEKLLWLWSRSSSTMPDARSAEQTIERLNAVEIRHTIL